MSGQEKSSTQAGEPIRAPRHFPGFDGNWERKELRPYLVRHLERVPADTDLRIYSSSREGLLPQDEYYGGHNRINDGEYGVVPEGHFVYRHMSDDTTFKFNINNTGQPIAVSKEYPVFTTDGVDSTFLRYLLNESYPFKQFAAMQRKGGTRTRLYFEALCSWRAPLPSLPEQERIAECLASIDALIKAETEKVDALKDHKQGLMQQLFPAEGESLPLLRFRQFEDQEDWRVTPLGDECDLYQPQTLSKSQLSEDGEFLVYGANGVIGRHVEYNHAESEVIVTCRGATCGEVHQTKPMSWITGNAMVVRPKSPSLHKDFLAHLLRADGLQSVITGSAQPQITRAGFAPLPVAIPPSEDEQEAVASTISSVDTLIASQKIRVEVLKNHKQGLLQQLFPVLDEVDG